MGIPAFYRWLSERYPLINKEVVSGQIVQVVDNLYLDVNGIIHNCVSSYNPGGVSMSTISRSIVSYIDQILKFVCPRKLLFIAVDGVAPRAKITQQRSRRFRSAYDADLARQEGAMNGMNPEWFFDKNSITPGTEFMQLLHEHLQRIIPEKVRTDPMWNRIRVHYSGYSIPGEGEHKIVEYIRQFKRGADYEANLVHCFYGLDSDLIVLALSLHERHMVLFREKVVFGGRDSKITSIEERGHEWQFLFISVLRESLEQEFGSYGIPGFDLERIIDDFALIVCFCGNDFLPRIPFVYIKHGSFNRLMESYLQFLRSGHGYLTDQSHIVKDSLNLFFDMLCDFEEEEYSDIQGDYDEMFTGRNQRYRSETENKQYGQMREQMNAAEAVLGKAADYRSVYYYLKFGIRPDQGDRVMRLVEDYMSGLEWVLGYYYRGCPSWSWVYPYHYAPFVSNIPPLETLNYGNFTLDAPLDPFRQLLCCLPPQSSDLLPPGYRRVMEDLKDFYPRDFRIDKNYMLADFEGVVLIPFIDYKRMEQALQRLHPETTLSVRDRARAQSESVERLYWFDKAVNMVVESGFDFNLPDPEGALVNIYSLQTDPSYFLGPTIHPIVQSRVEPIGVTVFMRPSQNPSLILSLQTFSEELIHEHYETILRECLYCHYPAFLLCVPVAILTPRYEYRLACSPLDSVHMRCEESDSIRVVVQKQSAPSAVAAQAESLRRLYLRGDGQHVGFGGLDLTGSVGLAEVHTFRNWVLLGDQFTAQYSSTTEVIPVELLRKTGVSVDLNPAHQPLLPGGRAMFRFSELLDGRNLYGGVVSVLNLSNGVCSVLYETMQMASAEFPALIRDSVPDRSVPLERVCQEHGWRAMRVKQLLGFLNVGRFEVGLHLYLEERREYNPLYVHMLPNGGLALHPEAISTLLEYASRFGEFFSGAGAVRDPILKAIEQYFSMCPCRRGPLFPVDCAFAPPQALECAFYGGRMYSQIRASAPQRRYRIQVMESHLLQPSVLDVGLLLMEHHRLYDRVQTTGQGSFEEGLQGTVIGLRGDGERLWVLLDEPHASGTDLGGLCPAGHGACLDWWCVLNLSRPPAPKELYRCLSIESETIK